MSSYYAQNPHYAPDSTIDIDVERFEECEKEAMVTFRSLTKEALAEHTRAILDIMPCKDSPKWARLRDAADRKYRETSIPARALYERHVADLLATGEISPELDADLTAFRDAQRAPLQQAAE